MLDEIPPAGRASPLTFGGGFVAGTPVWTDKGKVPIEQMKVGDAVLSQPEGGGEAGYRAATRRLVHDDKEIVCVTYVDHDKPNSSFVIYPTDNHPFWVEGAGWTRSDQLRGSHCLRLRNGRLVNVVMASPVYRTSRPHIGWYNDNMYLGDIGSEADFSGAPRILDHEAAFPDEKDGPDPRLKVRVYDLEVEDFHAYYVGAQGVWARSTRGVS